MKDLSKHRMDVWQVFFVAGGREVITEKADSKGEEGKLQKNKSKYRQKNKKLNYNF